MGYWGNKWGIFLQNQRRLAFTLCEILIVLGIIGIIAEMTIPDLVSNFQKQVTVTRLEQTYSMLQQVIKLSEIDNGPVSTWDFSPGAGGTIQGSHAFFDTYFKPYFVNPKFCSEGGSDYTCGRPVSNSGINYMLNNGVGFSTLHIAGQTHILIDLNNAKGPNSIGKDVFYFLLLPDDNGLRPYGYVKGMTRASIISQCIPTDKLMCTALIMFDGWQIADDYPW